MVATRLYCFCGVDGAGKSTLVDELERRNLVPGATFLRRPKLPEKNGAMLRRFFPRRTGDGRDWIEGDFAEAMGIGLAFEFLEHYRKNIEPLFGKESIIVCDRYALCFEAYLLAIDCGVPLSGLFDELLVPTQMFYVHVPEDVLFRRYHSRGGVQDDEEPEVMRRFDRAYRRLLPLRCPESTLVDNAGTFEDTLHTVVEKLRECES